MLGQSLVNAEREKWAKVPVQMFELAAICKAAADDIRFMASQRPTEFIDAFYSPLETFLTLHLTKEADTSPWHDMLEDLNYDYLTVPCGVDGYSRCVGFDVPHWDPPVVKIAQRPYAAVYYQEKRAYSPTLRTLGAIGGWNPDLINHPNFPSPAAAMLATGLLGAGAGYGLGSLAESVMPESWQRKGSGRRTGALIGGLAGVAPGALWAYANHANGHGVTEGWPLDEPLEVSHPETKTADEHGYPWWETPVHDIEGGHDENREPSLPPIDVAQFTQTVWHDPYVSQQLTPQMQALSTGLVAGASHLAGTDAPATLISPWDVAKMTAGMGTGYLSGALVGKALGMLMGMPQETQEHLKQTGMWAGAIANIVPIAFGQQHG